MRVFLLMIALSLLAFSCAQAPANSSTTSSSRSVSSAASSIAAGGNTAAKINNLPELKLKNAPDSLAANSDLKLKLKNDLKGPTRTWVIGKGASQPKPSASRAMGDITSFDMNNLSDVKSQGWINMRSQLKESQIMVFLDILKSYASNRAANGLDVPTGTNLALGVWYVDSFQGSIDVGQVRCETPSENEFDAYWTINVPMSGSASSSAARLKALGLKPAKAPGAQYLVYVFVPTRSVRP